MGSEWCEYKIGDLGKVVTGKTPSTKIPKYFGGQYPFITIPDMGTSVYISETARTLSQAGVEVMKSCRLPKGSVMMSCIATIGKCGITTKDSFTNQQINSVICDHNKVHPLYLYYIFTQLGFELDAAGGGGSVYTNVSKSRFSEISVIIPPMPEQRAIAHILGSLDDKIELNRRMNKTLEAIARAIFKSWFVDFDPVRAKAKGRPTGLPDDIAALFPDSFEDSELGEIPKGWTVGTLENFATLKAQTIKPNTKPEKIWEHYSIPAFDEGKQPIWESGINIKSGKYTVPSNSVLASKLNPQFPRVWLPDVNDTDSSICSTEFMPFVPILESWRPYLYEMLKSQTMQSEIISRVTGSTGSRQRVKPKEIAVLPCQVPPKMLVDFFCCRVGPLHDILLSNIQQSASLSSLRDTLLPKLISGELHVPDAENFIEEAVL